MKPNTYTQLYVQIVFATKYRMPCLKKVQRQIVWKYISAIITNKGHKSIIVNGMPDHVHLLVGLNPKSALADLIRDIKRSSSLFINDRRWMPGKFRWQEGYGAFSYSRSQLSNVYRYIQNQEIHHQKRSFRDEYLGLLRRHHVDFDQQFLFEFYDE
jgi:putative transposase